MAQQNKRKISRFIKNLKIRFYLVGVNSFCSISSFERRDEAFFELLRVGVQKFVRRLCEDEQLPLVGLAHRVALEPVLVSEELAKVGTLIVYQG